MVDRDLRADALRFGPVALLLFAVAFMLWIRSAPIDRVVTDSRVIFSGTDAWYHQRTTEYAVRYFPGTTPFDPWSNYPFGTGRHSGFGGLFDQLVALGALVVGLGSPGEGLVDVVLALAPVVFGALTAIPTYFLGKRLTDRWGGAVAAVLLALTGGAIVFRTVVGAADHQSAEPLFATAAVAGFAAAVAVAYRAQPTRADVAARNWGSLRRPTVGGIVGGIALAAYLMVWPPGVMLLVPLGGFVVVQLAREHVAGRRLVPLTVAAVVASTTAGVLTLAYARSLALEATAYSLLQPLVAFGLAAGTLVLFSLSRLTERNGYDRRYYPPAILGLVAGSLGLLWLVFPRGVEMLRELVVRVYSFGLLTSPSAGTVVEIRPATIEGTVATFGGLLPLAVAGFVLLVATVVRENRPVALLVVLWSLTTVAAYFTMSRFEYYFAVIVAVLGGVAVRWTVGRIHTSAVGTDANSGAGGRLDIGPRQVVGVALLVALILALVVPGNVVAVGDRQPVWEEAEAPWGTDESWLDGLDWLRSNTPTVPLDYYERFERPSDGDFDYPDGAYGVVSTWGNGHWITAVGRRIPYANPFQEGAVPAAAFFLATDERRADLVLAALPALADHPERVANLSTEGLRAAIAGKSPDAADENGRYVVVDHEMATTRFPSLTDWAGPDLDAYLGRERYRVGDGNLTLPSTNARYDDTLLAELYYGDASGLGRYRLVREVDRYSLVGSSLRGDRARPLTSRPLDGGWTSVADLARRLRVADDASGIGRSGRERVAPDGAADRVGDAVFLGGNRYAYDASVESRVKIYERVEGATLSGRVPNASEFSPVTATLELRTHTGRTFTYVRETTTGPNGSFEMTVPYATTDAVEPADGGTNASVRAVGPYRVRVGNRSAPWATARVAVPEAAIYGGQTVRIPVDRAE